MNWRCCLQDMGQQAALLKAHPTVVSARLYKFKLYLGLKSFQSLGNYFAV